MRGLSFSCVTRVCAATSLVAVGSLGSGCTTFLPAPVKVDETEISRTPLDTPRMMTQEVSTYKVTAETEPDEHDPSQNEISGQGKSVTSTYRRCVQHVEVEVDEQWRREYSTVGYVLDGTGAAAFGLIGGMALTAGLLDPEQGEADDGANANLIGGGIMLAVAAGFGYSIYAGLADSGDVETRRTTRKQWVDAKGCDTPTPSPAAKTQ